MSLSKEELAQLIRDGGRLVSRTPAKKKRTKKTGAQADSAQVELIKLILQQNKAGEQTAAELREAQSALLAQVSQLLARLDRPQPQRAPVPYRFTIERDRNQRMQSVIAEPVVRN